MKDIAKKTETELIKLVAEKREALREFRFGMKGSRTRETKQGATLRKDVARILTYQNMQRAQGVGAEQITDKK